MNYEEFDSLEPIDMLCFLAKVKEGMQKQARESELFDDEELENGRHIRCGTNNRRIRNDVVSSNESNA